MVPGRRVWGIGKGAPRPHPELKVAVAPPTPKRSPSLAPDWPGGPILRSWQPARAQTHPQPSRAQTHASQALAFSPGSAVRGAPQGGQRERCRAAIACGGRRYPGLECSGLAQPRRSVQGGPAFGARTKLVTRRQRRKCRQPWSRCGSSQTTPNCDPYKRTWASWTLSKSKCFLLLETP